MASVTQILRTEAEVDMYTQQSDTSFSVQKQLLISFKSYAEEHYAPTLFYLI